MTVLVPQEPAIEEDELRAWPGTSHTSPVSSRRPCKPGDTVPTSQMRKQSL